MQGVAIQIEKINKDNKEVRDKYNSLAQDAQDLVDNMFGFSVKAFINSLQPIEEIHSQTYTEDSFQYFLGLNDGQQKEIISTHQNKVKAVLFQAKNSLENILNYLEKIVK